MPHITFRVSTRIKPLVDVLVAGTAGNLRLFKQRPKLQATHGECRCPVVVARWASLSSIKRPYWAMHNRHKTIASFIRYCLAIWRSLLLDGHLLRRPDQGKRRNNVRNRSGLQASLRRIRSYTRMRWPPSKHINRPIININGGKRNTVYQQQ